MKAHLTCHDNLMRSYRTKGLELFYSNGYHATSQDYLLSQLQLSEDDFTATFQSKEEFYMGILQNMVFPQILNLLVEPPKFRESPYKLLLDVFGNAMENAGTYENDRGSMLAVFLSEFKGKDCRIGKYLTDIYKIWQINITSILKKGKTDGYVDKHVDCDSAASFILASYFGTRCLMASGNKAHLKDAFLQQMSSYFYSLSLSE